MVLDFPPWTAVHVSVSVSFPLPLEKLFPAHQALELKGPLLIASANEIWPKPELPPRTLISLASQSSIPTYEETEFRGGVSGADM